MHNEDTAAPTTDDAAQASDVDALAAPAADCVTIGLHRFSVTPMKVRQVFPFLKAARPLFDALASRKPARDLPPGAEQATQGVDVLLAQPAPLEIEAAMADAKWVLDMLENHGEAAVDALAVGCDIPRADLEELEVVGLVTLLKHFVKVNASFFVDQGLSLPQLMPANLGAASQAARPGKR